MPTHLQNMKRQLRNTNLALSLWLLVKPSTVTRDLGSWECGTQACFGGHLKYWPQFRRQGVVAGGAGLSTQVPEMVVGNSTLHGASVSAHLFGYPGDQELGSMFSARQDHERGSDHRIVVKRLQGQAKHLEAQIADYQSSIAST